MMIPDIVVTDRLDRPVLVVETKAKALSPRDFGMTLHHLQSYKSQSFAFGMIADFEQIRIFGLDAGDPPPQLLSLGTTDVLSHYDPEFDGRLAGGGSRRVFHDYFNALVEAWLRDLAYRWKSEAPPALDRLSEIGLASLLEGGATYDEVPIGGDTLR